MQIGIVRFRIFFQDVKSLDFILFQGNLNPAKL